MYGGGALATVRTNTSVVINDGLLAQDVYGGGKGELNDDKTVKASADVRGNTSVTVNGGKFDVQQYTAADAAADPNHAEGMLKQNYNVYGGGNLACVVGSNTSITFNAAMLPESFFAATGSGPEGSSQYRKWGETYAQHHSDKAIQGSVFGAGYGKNTQVLGNSTVDINIGEAEPALADESGIQNLFALAKRGSDLTGAQLAEKFVITALGGGYDGTVSGDTHVTIEGSPMLQNVFGGGLGSASGAAGDPYSEVGTVYGGAYVNIYGGTIYGDVFGSGAGITGDIHIADRNIDVPYYNAGWVRRETAVKVGKEGKDIQGITIFGNIYGGGDIANTGWYTAEVTPLEKFTNQDMNLYNALVATSIHLNAGNVLGDVFGGGNGRANWYEGYTGEEFRTHRSDILGSMCGSTLVVLDGATVWGDIYGGGKTGRIVTPATAKALNYLDTTGSARSDAGEGSTYVYIKSGKVGKNIYGGGLGDVANGGNTVTAADVLGNTIVFFENADLAFTEYWSNAAGRFLPQDNEGEARGTATDVLHNLYGGGNLACSIGTVDGEGVLTYGGNTHVLMKGSPTVDDLDALKNIGYFQRASLDVGLPHFSAFGGGYGTKAVVLGNTTVDVALENGSGFFEAIGGGLNGPIMGSTTVNINTNDKPIHGVYGGGYYAKVHKGTTVNITYAQITEDVFGGGALGDIGKSKTGDTSITMNIRGGTIAGNVYGANDVSGTVEGLVKLNITGGTINKNVYGAGNGDHIGYYEPGRGHYDVGENDNYYVVDHSDDRSKDGKNTVGPKGITYKGRPQTPAGVEMYLADATIMGQVFGGGNSCTVGEWETNLSSKYGGDPHKWRDDPDFFKGGGKVNIKLGSNVTIGQSNADVSDDYKNEDGENVSGLFMGNNGAHLATQSTAEDDYFYHHYYDKYTAKYWPGFAVYQDDGTSLLSREDGLKSFNAYLNNILMWTDDVSLSFDDGATGIWLANFVGGGFRGSMKAKTTEKKFAYTLPAGVTIGNCAIGGAYNTDVVYRIFDTTDGHTYKEVDGHYQYLKSLDGLAEGTDYRKVEYGADETKVKGIYRFVYDGGVLSNNGSVVEDFSTLNLQCNFDGGEKARVFGGCYASGIIQGDAVINYEATDAYDVYGGGALADVKGSTKVNLISGSLTNAYGGGLGRLADTVKDYAPVPALVYGDATVTLGKGDGEPDQYGYYSNYTASVVNGSIFGANNVNGTPLGHVKVHVLKTMSRGQDNRNVAGNENNFDVKAVYGGGNKAAYVPTGSIGEANSLTDKTKFAEVLIENCDNSIAYVYGGGNAAPVPATSVTIYGADAIDNAFAGGNGKGDGNKGADIGYLGFYSETGSETPEYGSGETHITIYGGTVNNVFGGSNTLGFIRTHAYVDVPEFPDDYKGSQCTLVLGNVHAGGNQAEMYCGGSVTLGCSEGSEVVYAGANAADIHGDIDLVISSGTYGKVFGGNNKSGNIYGHINVKIDETGCWPVMIGELYACGNEAPYSVYGYTNEGPRTKEQYDAISEDDKSAKYDDPKISLISFTRIGKVFGGGFGEPAVVHGNTNIYVEPIPGTYASGSSKPNYILNANDVRVENTGHLSVADGIGVDKIGSIGTIYGGGNAGAVYGSTEVKIGTLEKNKHISGTDKTTEHEVAVTITGNVFGGGNKAIVSGDTNVKIGADED